VVVLGARQLVAPGNPLGALWAALAAASGVLAALATAPDLRRVLRAVASELPPAAVR
jgi:hypothetical protein